MKQHFHKLPFKFKLWWAKQFLYMFKGFGSTFNEIAKKLNDTGYKTVTDIDFNGPNLIVKYHNYKTRGKKIYDIKNKNKNKI